MEEILYKGKDYTGKWVFGLPIRLVEDDEDVNGIQDSSLENIDIIPETLSKYIGINDKKDVKIFENDVSREETEYDEGDRVEYYVCKYIKELCRYVWLHLPGDYNEYMCTGIKNLDMSMLETFSISEEDSDTYLICGNIIDTPNFTIIGQKKPEDHG